MQSKQIAPFRLSNITTVRLPCAPCLMYLRVLNCERAIKNRLKFKQSQESTRRRIRIATKKKTRDCANVNGGNNTRNKLHNKQKNYNKTKILWAKFISVALLTSSLATPHFLDYKIYLLKKKNKPTRFIFYTKTYLFPCWFVFIKFANFFGGE